MAALMAWSCWRWCVPTFWRLDGQSLETSIEDEFGYETENCAQTAPTRGDRLRTGRAERGFAGECSFGSAE
ncbi:MAG TPA: hypothetical protein VGV90_04670, partial [Solirubrobacteraceae bacterium]|nr:hypothetical protein [Solirubrobacteraceae bacterium]